MLHNKEAHLGMAEDVVEMDKVIGVEAQHHDKKRPDKNIGQ